MAKILLYKTYMFKNKDPAIDQLRTAMEDEGMSYTAISVKSGVTITTLRNWFEGATRRPQHATIMAVARSMNRDYRLVKVKMGAN